MGVRAWRGRVQGGCEGVDGDRTGCVHPVGGVGFFSTPLGTTALCICVWELHCCCCYTSTVQRTASAMAKWYILHAYVRMHVCGWQHAVLKKKKFCNHN